MRKTIKVDTIKKEIEKLVYTSMSYYKEGNSDMEEYCYNKAIAYLQLLQTLAIDYSNTSFHKEFDDLSKWFTEITNNAIYK